ncbi:hypothetical protein BH11PSE2_BH11PSE2_14970 [soil metagenome]
MKTRWLGLPMTLVLVLGAAPAMAQNGRETDAHKAEIRARTLSDKARGQYNAGQDAENAGRFSAACDLHKAASSTFADAQWANMSMMTASGSDAYDRDVVSQNATSLARNGSSASDRSKIVCGKPDAPRTTSGGGSSGGGSGSGSSSGYSSGADTFNFESAQRALQATLDGGFRSAQSAVDAYKASQYTASCTSAKASAYAQAAADARDILGRRNYSRTMNIHDIDDNAKQSAADARDFYCQ